MTDILFTHSYFLRFDPKEYEAMTPYPPLGTLYAAAVAREAGYSVSLFDTMLADSEEEIKTALEEKKPRFVVIYDDDFNYLTKMCLTRMREAAFRMARIATDFGATVIVHSSDATDHIARYADHGVHYILVGEAEQTLVELLATLQGTSQQNPEDIPGVVWRDSEGNIRRGPKRSVSRDLDTLPYPARDLVDIERYRAAWKKRHGYYSVNMVTTRGCPFHCNWCAKPLYGQVYNSHSPQRIAREMRHIKEEWAPDHIWFCDDIFGLKPGWIEAFAQEVEELDCRIPFKCLSRADLLLRGNTIESLRRAGCTTVWMGAESGSQDILDAMDKGTTVEEIEEATARLKAAGIRVGFFLQFGYPGEEAPEIRETLHMVRTSMPDEIGISVSYPLPGTPFYERVRAEMGAKQNWSESADLAMMYRGTYSTEFYRALSRYVHMDHRLRLARRSLLRTFRSFRKPDTRELRRICLMPYYLVSRMLHRVSLGVRQRPAHSHSPR